MPKERRVDARGRSNHHPDRKRSTGRGKKRNRKILATKPSEQKSTISISGLNEVPIECDETGNRIIDINILFPVLEIVVSCSNCHNKLHFSESKPQGLAFTIDIECDECGVIASVCSSKKVGQASRVNEINRRSVVAAQVLGHGHAGLSTFCGILDLPKPVESPAFNSNIKNLLEICEEVAKESMREAVAIEKYTTESENGGLDVYASASWIKKDCSSLVGFTSLIGYKTGCVIDVLAKSSYCRGCCMWEGKENTTAYLEWFEEHQPNCSVNHEDSAVKLEIDGIKEMFLRSEKNYNVKYANFVGNSNVYKVISEAKPYGENFIINRKESIEQIQKRMAACLRDLKQTLIDTVDSKEHLTGEMIDWLISNYTKSIQNHSESLQEMYNSIWATYYHEISTDENHQHHLCPTGENSWCKWQKAQTLRKSYKHKSTIPPAIMANIKSIYEDFSNPELLKKCLGNYIQTFNENFHDSVWKLAPEINVNGLAEFKTALYMAVSHFNDGRKSFSKTMERFNLTPGQFATEWLEKSNDKRLFNSEEEELNTEQKTIDDDSGMI